MSCSLGHGRLCAKTATSGLWTCQDFYQVLLVLCVPIFRGRCRGRGSGGPRIPGLAGVCCLPCLRCLLDDGSGLCQALVRCICVVHQLREGPLRQEKSLSSLLKPPLYQFVGPALVLPACRSEHQQRCRRCRALGLTAMRVLTSQSPWSVLLPDPMLLGMQHAGHPSCAWSRMPWPAPWPVYMRT